MKTKFNFKYNLINIFMVLATMVSATLLSSCGGDDPVKEDTPELITQAMLTFTPDTGGDAIIATATDPDGLGVQGLETNGPIYLTPSTAYTLNITFINELADPSDEEYNVTAEVEEEGIEHMLFFSWTENVFTSPTGNGNYDNRDDAVNYEDEDDNGLPLGLITSWTTGEATTGKFRVVLKHQPELKSPTSTSGMGETDLDVEFDIEIE